MKSLLIATLAMVGAFALAEEGTIVNLRMHTSIEYCEGHTCRSTTGQSVDFNIEIDQFNDGEYWFERTFVGDVKIDRSVRIDNWGWNACELTITNTYMKHDEVQESAQMIRCNEFMKVKADRFISEYEPSDESKIKTTNTIYMRGQ